MRGPEGVILQGLEKRVLSKFLEKSVDSVWVMRYNG
jgi:hypothetical protein